MANWNGLQLTNKGIALQAKVQAGTQLHITKLKLGSGVVPSGTDVKTLTDLIAPEQNLGIGGKEAVDDYCKISSTISNTGLEAGYYVRELGVFAQDPDDGEILYMYTTDGAPDYLPAGGGSTVISQEFSVMIAVDDTDNIVVDIDPAALATMGYVQLQIQEHNTDTTAHADFTGATAEAAGKRGMVPAPAAGDQNKALFGNGTYKDIPLPEIASLEEAEGGTDNEKMMTPLRSQQLLNKLKVNNISAVDNNIDINRNFFNSLTQLGLEYTTVTPETLAETMPNNSIITFYVSSQSSSGLYAPNFELNIDALVIVTKGASANVPVKFEAIGRYNSNIRKTGTYTNANSWGFSGWNDLIVLKETVAGAAGYRLYSDGFVEMWGTGNNGTFTYPLTLTEVYRAWGTHGSQATVNSAISISSLGTSSLNYLAQNTDYAAMFWIIGKKA